MAVAFQVTVDCADPARQARFWAEALGYRIEDPPEGFATWRAYWLSIGVPPDELGEGDCSDSIVDPAGAGPRIWFQQVPEGKVVKNRIHFDVLVGGGRTVSLAIRKERVDAMADRLVQAGATRLPVREPDAGIDHYFVAMADPEGNEFDVV
jgi:catechol 2,3-dioxygenase-like lactoylglutathione lyase family enzyme